MRVPEKYYIGNMTAVPLVVSLTLLPYKAQTIAVNLKFSLMDTPSSQ